VGSSTSTGIVLLYFIQGQMYVLWRLLNYTEVAERCPMDGRDIRIL
jgi:hypothetical protein